MINSNIILGQYIDKKGLAQVYLQLSINRKVKRYPLFKIQPELFDQDKQVVKGKLNNRENQIILRARETVNSINIEYAERQSLLSFELYEHLSNRRKKSAVLIQDLEQYATEPTQISASRKLAKYYGTIKAAEFTSEDAEKWLQLVKLKQNTLCEYVNTLRSIWEKLKNNKQVNSNPWGNIHIKQAEVIREYLTMEELDRIEDLELDDGLNIYRLMFLFQCYTGLRLSDVTQLRWSDIQQGAIQLKMQKTKKVTYVPISKRAGNILDKLPRTGGEIFSKASKVNLCINRHIGEICRRAGITKKITSHCGRHTFAIQSLNLRIPIEVVSKLLGHSEIRTTQIYAKVANPLIVDYMKNWD